MDLIPDEIDFQAYMHDAEDHAVLPASDFLQKTIDLCHRPSNAQPTPAPLWSKCKGKIAFRPGELSLWVGINGHGKSMMLSQVALDLMVQREKVLSMSFEMLPERQMQRMARQAYAGSEPPIDFIRRLHAWSDGRLWIYDHLGSIAWQKVIAVMRYAHEKFGITQFVVDSLMKCVKGETDYDNQKDFVNDLCSFAQSRRVHVHLVHHVRKSDDEEKMPGKFDAKGAGAITDMVDNVFIVWKNKKAIEGKDSKSLAMPTACVKCDKQRHFEWEGTLGFWFDVESFQYLETASAQPMRYDLRK